MIRMIQTTSRTRKTSSSSGKTTPSTTRQTDQVAKERETSSVSTSTVEGELAHRFLLSFASISQLLTIVSHARPDTPTFLLTRIRKRVSSLDDSCRLITLHRFMVSQSSRSENSPGFRSLTSILAAVEYRLLPDSPFPAALQDAVSVYTQLIRSGVPSHKIVFIGDSAGGNIVLALARWIRDEKKSAPPGGLLLLSVRNPRLPHRISLTEMLNVIPSFSPGVTRHTRSLNRRLPTSLDQIPKTTSRTIPQLDDS